MQHLYVPLFNPSVSMTPHLKGSDSSYHSILRFNPFVRTPPSFVCASLPFAPSNLITATPSNSVTAVRPVHAYNLWYTRVCIPPLTPSRRSPSLAGSHCFNPSLHISCLHVNDTTRFDLSARVTLVQYLLHILYSVGVRLLTSPYF